MTDSPDPSQQEHGESLGRELLAAIVAGERERVSELLASGANPLAVNDEGVPAFMAPALIGNPEMQRLLLQAGVSPDLATSAGGVGDGDTACGICVLKLCTQELEQQQIRDLYELIGLLLEHDANVDVEGCRIAPLPMVARLGSLNLVNAFLRAGADQDAVLTEPDPEAGKTALEVAQEGGHDDIVAALLEAQQGG
jgi:ankyrin repeat protein